MRIDCSLPVRLVLGRDVDDAVGVDVEGDLDLRHAARRRRDADQVELAEQLVVRRHRALALEDPDGHRGLVVVGGREDLALLGRDGGVALDQRVNTPPRVSMPSVSGVTSSSSTSLTSPCSTPRLDRRAQRHDLVRIDALVRLAAEEAPSPSRRTLGMRVMPPTRTTSSMSARLQARVLQRLLAGADGLLDQVVDQASSLARVSLMLRCSGPDRVHR